MQSSALRLAVTLLLALGSPSIAATWIVDPVSGGHATTIQGAVGLASEGDVILIRPGTYPEQVTLPTSLSLIGESGRDVTIVDAEDTRAYCVRNTSGVSSTLIEGLTLTGVNGGYGFCTGVAAVYLNGSSTIRDCAIVDNITPRGPVHLMGSGLITGTRFAGNVGMGWGCGQTDPDHGTGCVRAHSDVTLEGCTFEGNSASDNSVLDILWGQAVVRDCVFRGNTSYGGLGGTGGMFASEWGSGAVHLENNLFVDNYEEPLCGTLIYGQGGPVLVTVVGNTFARNADLFVEPPFITAGSSFHANVFTESLVGLHIPEGVPVTVSCNDSWGNQTDWLGFTPSAGDGNFSAAPKYCAPANDDFTVASNSPLLPSGNSCGTLIGAFGVGCGPISVEPTTWGRLKSQYR